MSETKSTISPSTQGIFADGIVTQGLRVRMSIGANGAREEADSGALGRGGSHAVLWAHAVRPWIVQMVVGYVAFPPKKGRLCLSFFADRNRQKVVSYFLTLSIFAPKS
jgi:hypothetical protein